MTSSEIFSSTWYQELTKVTNFAMVMLAVALAIICVVQYSREKGTYEREGIDDPWLIVIATLRDMFAVTAIYLVIDYLRSLGLTENSYNAKLDFISFFQIFRTQIEFFLLFFAVVISVRRLFSLTLWIRLRKEK